MPLFTETPPPPPSSGANYDADADAAHIKATEQLQQVVQAITELLDKYLPPQLITDSTTSMQYNVLAETAGSADVTPDDQSFPYKGTDDSDGSTPIVNIAFGTHNDVPPTVDGETMTADGPNDLTLDSGSRIVYVQVDYTFEPSGSVTVTDAMINSSDSTEPPESTIAGTIESGGSGTLYQTLFAVAVSYDTDGNASVVVAPNVGGSQRFSICSGGPSVNGPWGV